MSGLRTRALSAVIFVALILGGLLGGPYCYRIRARMWQAAPSEKPSCSLELAQKKRGKDLQEELYSSWYLLGY